MKSVRYLLALALLGALAVGCSRMQPRRPYGSAVQSYPSGGYAEPAAPGTFIGEGSGSSVPMQQPSVGGGSFMPSEGS